MVYVFDNLDIKSSSAPFRQGSLVEYYIPSAIGRELSGTQRGIILHTDEKLQGGTLEFQVCPLLGKVDPIAANLAVKIPTGESARYLRPDLTSRVSVEGTRHLCNTEGQPIVWS